MLQENNALHWYVVHTYSGYENKVAANLEKIVENRNLGHLIEAVRVPIEEEHKLFPSYVFVKMKMNDESWHVVRNITGVTGFVGPGSEPVVLSDDEVEKLGVESGMTKSLDFVVGDVVEITGGPFAGIIQTGKVLEVSEDMKKIKLLVNMAGRDSALELDASDVKKI